MEGLIGYMMHTRIGSIRVGIREVMISAIDTTEPPGLRFERSVATRLGCR